MNIDREIAEKVMGYKSRSQMYNVWYFGGEKAVCEVDAWHPSTDIAQAFEVVEKMRERGFKEFRLGRGHANIWAASFTKYKDIGTTILKQHTGYADTPAMAICKAALAVEP